MSEQLGNDATLQKLKKQEKLFNQKLKEAKKQVAKREAALKEKRALILGKALLSGIEQNSKILEIIAPVIEKHVKTSRDKKLLAFELPKKIEPARAGNS